MATWLSFNLPIDTKAAKGWAACEAARRETQNAADAKKQWLDKYR
jgi:hypothetical protein